MSNRNELLESIANTIQDYRAGEIEKPTPEHIDRWVSQFNESVRINILRELDYVLQKTYFNKTNFTQFLNTVINSKKLAGVEPSYFWQNIKFLNIQQGGNSQREMLLMFNSLFYEQYGLNISNCGANNPQAFLYLDDVLFSGNRIRNDISAWIRATAPNEAKVYIITLASHRKGQDYANREIEKVTKQTQKNIEFIWKSLVHIEDRDYYINTTDVLRPVSIPDNPLVNAYVSKMAYQPKLRRSGSVGELGFFMSDEGRMLLEQEMLIAGTQIRQKCPNLNNYQRPLGNIVLETLGFGSMIVTFRNCPNNTPLALWAGNPWYPLFSRKIN